MKAPNMAMNSSYGLASMKNKKVFKKLTDQGVKNIQSCVSSYAARHGVKMRTRSHPTKNGLRKLVVTRIA
jgi:hypothetical protein